MFGKVEADATSSYMIYSNMTIYENRNTSAYEKFKTEPGYAKNEYILKWWKPLQDQIISELIDKEQWNWPWKVSDEIVESVTKETLSIWKKHDPLCRKYAWYNVLMYFAVARAEVLGLTGKIRKPLWKTCSLCNKRFVEDSLPSPLVERFGVDHLDFCAPCLGERVLQGTGNDKASKGDALKYLKNLADILGRVPNQSFGEGTEDFRNLDSEERLAVLRLLTEKPTTNCIKKLFGSWLNALILAGVLEDGTRRTSRGTQCLAKDGHVCLSHGEKTIDDLLSFNNIHHEKEPRYPEGNYRADFIVGKVFIEYFGLYGNPEYDKKIRDKQRICKKHDLKLIAIYPKDLVSVKKLKSKILVSPDINNVRN